MKIILNRAQKVILLQALSDGYIYEQDLNSIKGITTIVPDKPMSRKAYEKLLRDLQYLPDDPDDLERLKDEL